MGTRLSAVLITTSVTSVAAAITSKAIARIGWMTNPSSPPTTGSSTPPMRTRTTRSSSSAEAHAAASRPTVLHLPRFQCAARIASGVAGGHREVSWQISRRLGRAAGASLSKANRTGHHQEGMVALAPARNDPGVGLADGGGKGFRRRTHGCLCRAGGPHGSGDRPCAGHDQATRRGREHAGHFPQRQRGQPIRSRLSGLARRSSRCSMARVISAMASAGPT